MKRFRLPQLLHGVAGSLAAFLLMGLLLPDSLRGEQQTIRQSDNQTIRQSDNGRPLDKPALPEGRPTEKLPRESQAWSDLSEADKKKLREALQIVWSDPTVLSARESVNRSAQEYQSAVREMIKKQNPETAKLLDRIQKSQPPGMMQPFLGDVPGMRKHFHDLSLASPAMMDRMNEEQKARFKEAEAKARVKPEVIAAMEELKTLAREDEEIRKKKMEAFKKLRHVHFDALIEIDPELKKIIPPPGSVQLPPNGGKGKARDPK